jgi:fermentation-respiration switch protein FrsA (DUF1100 family)
MRLLAAGAASLAFTLAITALLQGFADLAGNSARVWMQAWEVRGSVSDRGQWETALDRLNLARRLSPLSADFSADLEQSPGRRSLSRGYQQAPELGVCVGTLRRESTDSGALG